MKLPELYRVRKEDLPDAPGWFKNRFMTIYNQFTELMYLGLNKNITFRENIDVQYETITTRRIGGNLVINANNPYTFGSTLKAFSPIGVTVVQAIRTDSPRHVPMVGPVSVDWTESNGTITIYEIYNLESTDMASEEDYSIVLKVE